MAKNDFTSTGCQPSGDETVVDTTIVADVSEPTEITTEPTETPIEEQSENEPTEITTVQEETQALEETLRVMNEEGKIVFINSLEEPEWKTKFKHWSGNPF